MPGQIEILTRLGNAYLYIWRQLGRKGGEISRGA
jgi:hypothetical protein